MITAGGFASLFSWLLDATVKGAVVITLAAILMSIFGRRLGARWRHALWLMVLVRLALPFAPASRWSIFNLLRWSAPATAAPAISDHLSIRSAASGSMMHADVVWSPMTSGGVGRMVTAVWIIGALLVMVRLIISSVRLQAAVRRATRRHEIDVRLAAMVDEARIALDVKRPVRVVVCGLVRTPALHGLFHPTLLLPASLPESFGREELRHVILHELWHVRRSDVAINWMLSAVQAVHWFNPFVWFAVARIKEEREICCDELALSCLEEEERFGYGRTILKLLEHFRSAAPVPAMVGIVNHNQQMKRRLTMIASFKHRTRFSLLFVGVLAFVGAVAFADAQGADKRVMDKVTCEIFGKFDQRVSIDLTGATFGEFLNAVAAKSGSAVNQSPEIATSPIQQARFTIHAINVPAHLLLMESVMPFELAPKFENNAVTIAKAEGCAMKMRHPGMPDHSAMGAHEGTGEKREVNIVTSDSSDHANVMERHIEINEEQTASGGEMKKQVILKKIGGGSCKMPADGKLHRDLTLKFDENGTVSEGKLQLDIDAPPSR